MLRVRFITGHEKNIKRPQEGVKVYNLMNLIGRNSRIRTYDPFTPSEVRYQTAPCPDY